MARNKNSKRKHEVAPWVKGDVKPAEDAYKWLASGITTMSNDTEDVSEDYADYTGIDTTDVTGVKAKWTPSGFVDHEDEAQKIIIDTRFEVGDGRKIWHKWTETNGDVFEGVARILEPKVSGGDSNANEELSFTIAHEKTPEKTPAP